MVKDWFLKLKLKLSAMPYEGEYQGRACRYGNMLDRYENIADSLVKTVQAITSDKEHQLYILIDAVNTLAPQQFKPQGDNQINGL